MIASNYLSILPYSRVREPIAARTLAGVLASGYGPAGCIPPMHAAMGPDSFMRFIDECFPGAIGSVVFPDMEAELTDSDLLEYEDLVNLLLKGSSRQDGITVWLAHATAISCFGENHLWQDMGLVNRKALSMFLSTYFGPLAARNDRDMKWKKFFYKRICESSSHYACRSPRCEDCEDYDACFGPEDSVGAHLSRPVNRGLVIT